MLTALTVSLVIGAATACAPRVDVRGNLPDPERVAEIVPGEHSRELVEETLGSPSTKSTFGQETWLYVSNRTETLAFLEPEVQERLVLAIHFDEQGLVESVDRLGLEDGRDIELVERVTPTAGNELTFMDQLFGNLGRFGGGDSGGLPGQ
jgi:outer membrane protein assembly factor BamE (lipoprotein component of BamABCDE complex)